MRAKLLRPLPGLLDRLQPPEIVILGALAALLGVATGAGVWAFKALFNLIRLAAFQGLGTELERIGPWAFVFVPALGGLAVGVLRHYLIGHEQYHGVPGLMEAAALGGSRLPYRLLPAKTVASALSIGVGASVGPEDPSVQIGANLGSMFGQWLRLSDERMRGLAAAGAAAGIAAAFNAPIAGVFFALEIILGEFTGGSFGVVVLSSVVSAIFTQAVSGRQPAFIVPPYAFSSLAELPLYLILGLLAGPVAALYIKTLYVCKDFFAARRLPGWLEPGVAGLAVGVVGIFLPQIFGVGYDTIGAIFAGQRLPILLLLLLVFAKLLMTSVSIAGGFPGGLFAPSLFLGAALGAAFGSAAAAAFPGLGINPPAFAMVGMAAVLAGAVHAPLTAIILLFEMTNDYRIILPLMAAVGVSMAISQRLQHDSIYEAALARKGLRLQRGRDVEVLDGILVSDVMKPETDVLSETKTLAQAADIFARTHRHGLPVVDAAGRLTGIFTLSDMERGLEGALDRGAGDHESASAGEPRLSMTVGEACTRDLLVVYPDETIGAALRRMASRDIGRLPVVRRAEPARLVGILRRSDIIRAYDMALRRRAAARHHAEQSRLQAWAGSGRVTVDELAVQPGSPCAGRRVQEVPWPHDAMIVTVRRGGQLIIPHGDTVLHPGDVLLAVSEGPARARLAELCLRMKDQG